MSAHPYRCLMPLVLVPMLGLAGCYEDEVRVADYSPAMSGGNFQAESLVSRAAKRDVAGGAASAADASEARIEERRAYQLQFENAEGLVEAYRQTQQACVTADYCQVEYGRLNTPRNGLAGGELGIRIERERLDDAEPLKLIAESPALSGVEVTREDRTQQVIDLEARLDQQIVLRDRLSKLAEEGRDSSASSIEDLLQVERELARVQGEIESMQGQQRHFSRVTDSVAVSASFQEQRWVDPEEYGIFAPLWRALDRSTSLFFESVGQVILVVVFLTPWLVIGIPALWLLSRLWRPVRRVFGRLGEKRRARRRQAQADSE